MLLPNRHANTSDYRYGFNGMEFDNEIKGEGNSFNTDFRQYDPRIGRWMTMDPEYKRFPFESPYSFANNMPVIGNDTTGDYCVPCLEFVAWLLTWEGVAVAATTTVTVVAVDTYQETEAYQDAVSNLSDAFSAAPPALLPGSYTPGPSPVFEVETYPEVVRAIRDGLEEILVVKVDQTIPGGFDVIPIELQTPNIETIPAYESASKMMILAFAANSVPEFVEKGYKYLGSHTTNPNGSIDIQHYLTHEGLEKPLLVGYSTIVNGTLSNVFEVPSDLQGQGVSKAMYGALNAIGFESISGFYPGTGALTTNYNEFMKIYDSENPTILNLIEAAYATPAGRALEATHQPINIEVNEDSKSVSMEWIPKGS